MDRSYYLNQYVTPYINEQVKTDLFVRYWLKVYLLSRSFTELFPHAFINNCF